MRQFVFLFVWIILIAPPAGAQDDHDQALQAVKSGKIIALTKILAEVEQQFDGRIVEVELVQDESAEQEFVYKVELLTAVGDLIEIFYDARTGTPIAMGGQGFIEDRTRDE